ncbi:hypothetical protein ACKC9G_17070 [Pokkaliibacter sp. CJK22405]|uniref:hypothetical protein n=1 Tax=Pokkaliibacter sp. CJK22405 TaxID=3384615 RepID=UPI00398490B2
MKLSLHSSLDRLSRMKQAMHSERKKGEPATAAAPEKTVLEQRLERLRNQSMGQGNMAQALTQAQRRQWDFNALTQSDSLEETEFADIRRQELGIAVGAGADEAARQYGIRYARTTKHPDDSGHSLRFDNSADGHYLRDHPLSDYHLRCMELHREQGGKANDQMLFFNCRQNAERALEAITFESMLNGSGSMSFMDKHELKELRPGVLAYNANELDHRTYVIAQHILGTHGARPSAYALQASTTETPREANPRLDNLATLEDFTSPVDKAVVSQLQAMPEQHSLAELAHTTADLILSLKSSLEKHPDQQRIRHDPLLNEGLKGLHRMAAMLPSLSHDSKAFMNAYHATMEELQICLTASKPYGLADFRKAASQMLSARHLPASIPTPQMHLVTSGMNALTLGHELANLMHHTSRVDDLQHPQTGQSTPRYFEIPNIRSMMSPGRVDNKPAPTVFASLNGSLPGGGKDAKAQWGVDDLISSLDARLKQQGLRSKTLTMVLDATVEKRGDMDKLMSHFSKDIAKGKVRFIVCKSYQKYANLGSAKVMAGGVAIIGKDDSLTQAAREHLGKYEQDLNWMAGNDAQLLTHLLGQREHEFNQLDRGTRAAQYLRNHLFTGQGEHSAPVRQDMHLPFVVLDHNYDARHRFTSEMNQKLIDLTMVGNNHLPEKLIRQRDGFGYPETSVTYLPLGDHKGGMRLSVGQESPAELTEMFYLPSKLMQASGSNWTVTGALNEVRSLVAGALPKDAKTYPLPPLAERISTIARAEAPQTRLKDTLNADPLVQRQLQESDPHRGLTLNKIASVLVHLEHMYSYSEARQKLALDIGRPPCINDSEGDFDTPYVSELVDAMVQSGMPGVSSAARLSILKLGVRLCHNLMNSDDPQHQQQAMEALTQMALRMPETSLLNHAYAGVPEKVFADASDQARQSLVDALVVPLPESTQMILAQSLLLSDQDHKADAVLNTLDAKPHYGSRNPAAVLLDTPVRPPVMAASGSQPLSLTASQIRQKLESSESP